jgi:hypothetical protein
MQKILVQAPRSSENILLAFPFFIKLKESYPEAKIYVVVDSGLEENLELLPFKVEIYPLPQRLNSIPGIHKFAVNVKDIFNIELFFDLAMDHKGALTGFSFRAKRRFGVNEGIKKVMYTNKVNPFSDTVSLDERFINILNLSLENPISDFFFSAPDLKNDSNVVQLFEKEVNVDFFLIKNSSLPFSVWKNIILMMDSGRAVVWDQENLELWQALKSSGESKVELIIQGEVSGLSFLREIVPKSHFILTDDFSFAQSTYFFEKRSFLFSDSNFEFSKSKYFSNIENIILLEDNDPVSLMTYGEKKDISVPSEVVDYILETMNI